MVDLSVLVRKLGVITVRSKNTQQTCLVVSMPQSIKEIVSEKVGLGGRCCPRRISPCGNPVPAVDHQRCQMKLKLHLCVSFPCAAKAIPFRLFSVFTTSCTIWVPEVSTGTNNSKSVCVGHRSVSRRPLLKNIYLYYYYYYYYYYYSY